LPSYILGKKFKFLSISAQGIPERPTLHNNTVYNNPKRAIAIS
jgi:hypothetical protein